MKIRSCHGGMPDRLSGRTERRDKKNDVVMMSTDGGLEKKGSHS
jgi:hypothetical protein